MESVGSILRKRTDDVDFIPVEGIYTVTPKMAEEWLYLFQYQHQRKTRQYHVDNLASEMLEKRFREKTSISICECDGWFYITNGNHTLRAIVQSGVSVVLTVIVDHKKSMDEVGDDYSRQDNGIKRTLQDSVAAHDLAAIHDITQTRLSNIASASIYLAYLKREINVNTSTRLTHDKKLIIINRYIELGKNATAAVGIGQNKIQWATRRTTIAIVMLCYEKKQELCVEFWKALVDDDGLKKGDPRKTLLDFLLNSTTSTGGDKCRSCKKTYRDHELVKGIAAAWNAFVDRRAISKIVYRHDSKEVEISGVGIVTV